MHTLGNISWKQTSEILIIFFFSQKTASHFMCVITRKCEAHFQGWKMKKKKKIKNKIKLLTLKFSRLRVKNELITWNTQTQTCIHVSRLHLYMTNTFFFFYETLHKNICTHWNCFTKEIPLSTFTMGTILTLSIGTPYLLTILGLKLETVHSTTSWCV